MKKIIILSMMAIFLALGAAVSAAPFSPFTAKTAEQTGPWQAINFGKGNDNTFYFNKESIHYAIKDGKINKNILVYEEKKVNRNGFTLDNGYYSVTQAKLNLRNQTLFLGDETFYTPKGKVRWVNTPTYLIWYSITPGTMGADRYDAVADYAAANPQQIMQQTEQALAKLAVHK